MWSIFACELAGVAGLDHTLHVGMCSADAEFNVRQVVMMHGFCWWMSPYL